MNKMILIPSAVAMALSLAACDRAAAPADGNAAPTAEASATDADAVKTAFAAFNKALAAEDLPAVKAQYASDAVMVLPGQAPFNGVDAIMKDYAAFAADPAGKYVSGAETVEVSAGGDLAYGQVDYQATFTNPATKAVETVNRYNLSIYKKQADGSWKVVRDINVPLPKTA